MKLYFVFLLLLSTLCHSEVSITGGRYYLEVDGSRLDGYYNSDHTAGIAATNKAYQCGCTVTIVRPNYEVTWVKDASTDTGVTLSWNTPTARDDGSPLPFNEILGYNIYANDILVIFVEAGNNSVFVAMPPGTYAFSISTIDSDNNEGSKSSTMTLTIGG